MMTLQTMKHPLRKLVPLLALLVSLSGCGDPEVQSPVAASNATTASDATPDRRSQHIGKRQPLLELHQRERANLLIITADERVLVSRTDHRNVGVFELPSGKAIGGLEVNGKALSFACSAEPSILGIGTDAGHVELWDLATRERTGRIRIGVNPVYEIAMSSGGNVLSACAGDGTIQVRHAEGENPKRIFDSSGQRMASIAMSPSGLLVAGLGRDGECRVWNIDSGELIGKIDRATDGVVGRVQFLAEDELAIATPSRCLLWTLGANNVPQPTQFRVPLEQLLPQGFESTPANSLAPDGSMAATTVGPHVVVWDVASRIPKIKLVSQKPEKRSNSRVEALTFSSSGQFVVAGYQSGNVRVWQLKSGE